jgi:glycosyltransferase involved in cell wall biosynthesis
MKIALYQPWIYLYGGLEKSLLELVTRSEHEWIVYTGHYEPENTFKEFAQVDVRVLNPTSIKRTIAGTLRSAYAVARQKIPVDADVDAIVVWCDGIGDLVTFRNHQLPIFNICSTPLRAAFDPVYEQMSLKDQGFVYKVAYKTFKHLFKLVDRLAWSYYDGAVMTSTEVKNRVIKGKLCVNEEKMIMAYPGVEWRKNLEDISYEPFILLPGRIMWTKNIQLGIEAFIKADLPKPWKLVIAGFVDKKSQVYISELKAKIPEGVSVEFVVSPSDKELADLYKKAAFSLFTPLNEDWGIVPLESMNHGKAVIANASGGPLESIVDGKTGYLLPVNDVNAWANAISGLALNQPKCVAMGQQAHQHVTQFTWSEFVSRVDVALLSWANKRRAQVPSILKSIQSIQSIFIKKI